MDEEGWVPIELIANFPRVSDLTWFSILMGRCLITASEVLRFLPPMVLLDINCFETSDTSTKSSFMSPLPSS